MCLSLLSVNSTRVKHSSSYNLCFIDNVVFSNCKISHNDNGGAICFDNVPINLDISYTTFFSCQTTYSNSNGGAIYYYSSERGMTISNSCFSHCLSQYRGPCIHSNAEDGTSFINVAVCKCPDSFQLNTQYPIHIYRGYIEFDGLNSSYNYPKVYSSGLLICQATGYKVCFSTIANCKSGDSCIIDLQGCSGSQNGYNINVINNSIVLPTFGILYYASTQPILADCVFALNSNPLFRGDGVLTINNCVFDKYTFTYKSPVLINCSLSCSNPSTNHLTHINTLFCNRISFITHARRNSIVFVLYSISVLCFQFDWWF